ncbi:MAG: hypothetical protein JXA33_26590 [Anaerolineae bacterium]|nr:hypothetical protein [Anaerolineae bacterium]
MSIVKTESKKVYIEGVRRISWDTGEMCEFASALVSAMMCLGENLPYPYVMGTSGVAFRFTLNPGAWDFGNYGIRNISADAYAPIRRAIDAVGYAYTLGEKTTWQDDATNITASIDKGIPVLAYGVVGPSDCCIIAGYDEQGKVLLGWSTYQDIPDDHNIPHDVTGYFRKPGWHDNLGGYILIGDKKERPPLQTIYADALKWAVYLMKTPSMGDKLTGLEALKIWAEEMTQEKYFPDGDEETLGWRYVSAAVNMTMLRDHCSAEAFLRQVLEDVPDFQPELSLAAECYGDVKRIRNGMDAIIGDNFSEQAMRAIAIPEMRRAHADAILQIRDKEQEAVTHIEQLIERMVK